MAQIKFPYKTERTRLIIPGRPDRPANNVTLWLRHDFSPAGSLFSVSIVHINLAHPPLRCMGRKPESTLEPFLPLTKII